MCITCISISALQDKNTVDLDDGNPKYDELKIQVLNKVYKKSNKNNSKNMNDNLKEHTKSGNDDKNNETSEKQHLKKAVPELFKIIYGNNDNLKRRTVNLEDKSYYDLNRCIDMSNNSVLQNNIMVEGHEKLNTEKIITPLKKEKRKREIKEKKDKSDEKLLKTSINIGSKSYRDCKARKLSDGGNLSGLIKKRYNRRPLKDTKKKITSHLTSTEEQPCSSHHQVPDTSSEIQKTKEWSDIQNRIKRQIIQYNILNSKFIIDMDSHIYKNVLLNELSDIFVASKFVFDYNWMSSSSMSIQILILQLINILKNTTYNMLKLSTSITLIFHKISIKMYIPPDEMICYFVKYIEIFKQTIFYYDREMWKKWFSNENFLYWCLFFINVFITYENDIQRFVYDNLNLMSHANTYFKEMLNSDFVFNSTGIVPKSDIFNFSRNVDGLKVDKMHNDINTENSTNGSKSNQNNAIISNNPIILCQPTISSSPNQPNNVLRYPVVINLPLVIQINGIQYRLASIQQIIQQPNPNIIMGILPQPTVFQVVNISTNNQSIN